MYEKIYDSYSRKWISIYSTQGTRLLSSYITNSIGGASVNIPIKDAIPHTKNVLKCKEHQILCPIGSTIGDTPRPCITNTSTSWDSSPYINKAKFGTGDLLDPCMVSSKMHAQLMRTGSHAAPYRSAPITKYKEMLNYFENKRLSRLATEAILNGVSVKIKDLIGPDSQILTSSKNVASRVLKNFIALIDTSPGYGELIIKSVLPKPDTTSDNIEYNRSIEDLISAVINSIKTPDVQELILQTLDLETTKRLLNNIKSFSDNADIRTSVVEIAESLLEVVLTPKIGTSLIGMVVDLIQPSHLKNLIDKFADPIVEDSIDKSLLPRWLQGLKRVSRACMSSRSTDYSRDAAIPAQPFRRDW